MTGQDAAVDAASIEAISVVFAAVLVWLSALVQILSNAALRGPSYVLGDRSVPPRWKASSVAPRERWPTMSSWR